MRFWYKNIIKSLQLYMRLFLNLKIINPEQIEKSEGCIIAPNHIRATDPPYIGAIFNSRVFSLAKKELFDIPILGRIIRYLDGIPIRRGTIDRSALNRAKEALNNGYRLLIFPEGTRKSSEAKPGIGKLAYETNSDIVPIFIHYPKSKLAAIFRKDSLKIVLGEKIKIKDFGDFENRKEAYRYIAKYTLEKIMELENEC